MARDVNKKTACTRKSDTTSRRCFIKNNARACFTLAGSAKGLSGLGLTQSSHAASQMIETQVSAHTWLSASGDTRATYSLSWVPPQNAARPVNHPRQTTNVYTGFRGHGIAVNPSRTNQAVLIARRPGRECAVIDLKLSTISQRFTLPAGHQLEGHGCFSLDGKTFYTSESQYQTGEGIIGVYDTHTYQRLTQYHSQGIGPHEIKLLPQGNILVVANGGLHTKPDTGRTVHNLASMQPNLAYLHAATGEPIETVHLPESKASIRHIDIANDGTVALAMQVQRNALSHNHPIALAARHKLGEQVALFQQPEVLLHNLNDYLGSTVINNRFRTVASTSPRGNLAVFWHLDSHQLLGYYSLQDVCGIAVTTDEQHFIVTNSFGHVRHLNAQTLKEIPSLRQHYPNHKWDNHLAMV